jgi:predicted glycoside hydrolase/deacetylase ChbG (UPF0249 family)
VTNEAGGFEVMVVVKALIVNADDFGLTRGVNAGILQAHEDGIVTSTTLMVNMPGFSDAVAQAMRHPKLATGLHLNLTYGRPLSPANAVRSLVDDGGRFVKNPSYVLGNGRPDEMMTEFGAQVRRFLSTGLTLSHIDTHHHLHRSAVVLDLVVETAKELGVTVRCLDEQALRARGMVPQARFTNFFGIVTASGGSSILSTRYRRAQRRSRAIRASLTTNCGLSPR